MNVTVYSGASPGNKKIYKERTQQLGKWIVENNHTLVYGGGNVGLMGIIADTVLDNKGKVIGVIPHFLKERELAHRGLSEQITVDTMTQRKLKMTELGEVYIALPGGPGTLEEISEVISWARLGQNSKPCIFFNISGYYDSLKKFYDTMVKNEFLSREDRSKILFTDSFEEMEDFIKNYRPPEIRRYKP